MRQKIPTIALYSIATHNFAKWEKTRLNYQAGDQTFHIYLNAFLSLQFRIWRIFFSVNKNQKYQVTHWYWNMREFAIFPWYIFLEYLLKRKKICTLLYLSYSLFKGFYYVYTSISLLKLEHLVLWLCPSMLNYPTWNVTNYAGSPSSKWLAFDEGK